MTRIAAHWYKFAKFGIVQGLSKNDLGLSFINDLQKIDKVLYQKLKAKLPTNKRVASRFSAQNKTTKR